MTLVELHKIQDRLEVIDKLIREKEYEMEGMTYTRDVYSLADLWEARMAYADEIYYVAQATDLAEFFQFKMDRYDIESYNSVMSELATMVVQLGYAREK